MPVPAPTTTRIVQVGTIGGKQVLVDQDNHALYLFTADQNNVSSCTGACAATWPALPGPASAGTGVDPNNLKTSTRADGTVQVTYFGHPLYHFAGDQQPGQANGEGIGGTWFLVDAAGNQVSK